MKKNALVLSLLFLIVSYMNLLPLRAQAGNLFEGETVQLTYYALTTSDIYRGPWTAVTGGGVEFTNVLGCIGGGSCVDVDISDTNILVTMHFDHNNGNPGNFTAGSFNGIRIYDFNGTIPNFTSVTINPATYMAGFDASRINFDGDNIWVNWQGLIGDLNTIVSLDVVGSAAPVPEPATMMLLASGLAGLAGVRKRFKK